jgi:1-acyl-sn-glycerol-3-phosphate acyltransferase
MVIRTVVSLFLWIGASIYFVGYLLLALVLSYLLPFRTIDPLLKGLNRGFFRIFFTRVEVVGAEKLDPSESYIFVANHSSMLDVPLVAGFVPGFLRGIEASRQHGWPLYGWVMGRLGNIPIETDDVHASFTTMKRAEEYLKSGGSLMIFPEGHRTTTGRLLPFKKLPFHMAKTTGKPLAPFTIHGIYQVNNKNSLHIRPGRVTLRFGEVISAEECGRFSAVQLKARVEEWMREALEGAPGGGD